MLSLIAAVLQVDWNDETIEDYYLTCHNAKTAFIFVLIYLLEDDVSFVLLVVVVVVVVAVAVAVALAVAVGVGVVVVVVVVVVVSTS